jgi:glycosyltransferase involved in cell wall biosynthesis
VLSRETAHKLLAGGGGTSDLVERVGAAMRASDVYAFPSVRESGGATVMEAMASGKPVIVADHGGPAETVDAESGVRVRADGPGTLIEGVAEALWALGTDEARRLAMGRAARRRIEEGFTWESRIETALGVYDVVGRRGAVPVGTGRLAPQLLTDQA